MSALDNYVNSFGADGGRMAAIADQAGVSPDQLSAVVDELSKSSGKESVKVQFSVTITRDSVNIASDLTVPIFGPTAYDGNYDGDLPKDPGIVSRTYAKSATNGEDLVFSYNDGTATDTITINGQYGYLKSLNTLRKKELFVTLHKYTVVPAANASAWQAKNIALEYSPGFRGSQDDTFRPADYRSNSDFQTDIVTVRNKSIRFEDARFEAIKIPAVAGFTLTIYMEGILT